MRWDYGKRRVHCPVYCHTHNLPSAIVFSIMPILFLKASSEAATEAIALYQAKKSDVLLISNGLLVDKCEKVYTL